MHTPARSLARAASRGLHFRPVWTGVDPLVVALALVAAGGIALLWDRYSALREASAIAGGLLVCLTVLVAVIALLHG